MLLLAARRKPGACCSAHLVGRKAEKKRKRQKDMPASWRTGTRESGLWKIRSRISVARGCVCVGRCMLETRAVWGRHRASDCRTLKLPKRKHIVIRPGKATRASTRTAPNQRAPGASLETGRSSPLSPPLSLSLSLSLSPAPKHGLFFYWYDCCTNGTTTYTHCPPVLRGRTNFWG